MKAEANDNQGPDSDDIGTGRVPLHGWSPVNVGVYHGKPRPASPKHCARRAGKTNSLASVPVSLSAGCPRARHGKPSCVTTPSEPRVPRLATPV